MRIAALLTLVLLLAACDKLPGTTSPTQAAYNQMAKQELKAFGRVAIAHYAKHGALPAGTESAGYTVHEDVVIKVSWADGWQAAAWHKEGTKTYRLTKEDLKQP